MKKKPDPEMIDKDNPEWTDAMFAKARPASEGHGRKCERDLLLHDIGPSLFACD